MKIGICKETADLEKRVALTPDIAGKLGSEKIELFLEKGAGLAAGYPDSLYGEAGVTLLDSREELFERADLLLAVNTPPEEDLRRMRPETLLVCFIWALQNPGLVDLLCEKRLTALGLEAIPRISRAQSMDALSSMSNIAGYRSVLIAAMELNRYLPMMMTAAGTIPPARFLVIGAGVAGLQAIATAKRLGAVVEGYDIRPVVREQVESLGASFVDIPLADEDTETEGGYAKEVSEKNQEIQKQVLHDHVKRADAVITTALIPGKRAPLLIPESMVQDMKPGSVVVDLAAEQGGNCELTRPGETFERNGVRIAGPLNLPSTLAYHASQLYARNLQSLLALLIVEDELRLDFEDEIIRQTTITHRGEIVSPLLKST